MRCLGIDVSTRSVVVASLDFDSDAATVKVYDASECEGDALVRARTLADLLPRRRSSFYDDVGLVAIERPMGPGTRQVGDMMLVAGVVVACLPPELPVWLLGPTEWRKACGLKGNCSKDDVREFAWGASGGRFTGLTVWDGPPQDSIDAFAIAWAARALNEKGVAKGEAA